MSETTTTVKVRRDSRGSLIGVWVEPDPAARTKENGMETTTTDQPFNCARCKDTGAMSVAFYSARDTRCSCPAGDWLRIPEDVRSEIVAYITALEREQRRIDRHARRAARRAAAVT